MIVIASVIIRLNAESFQVGLHVNHIKFLCMCFIIIPALILWNMYVRSSGYVGKPIGRSKIRDNIKFRLERIPGLGNEGLYFIYKENEKLLYVDNPNFENGQYIKSGDVLRKVDDLNRHSEA